MIAWQARSAGFRDAYVSALFSGRLQPRRIGGRRRLCRLESDVRTESRGLGGRWRRRNRCRRLYRLDYELWCRLLNGRRGRLGRYSRTGWIAAAPHRIGGARRISGAESTAPKIPLLQESRCSGVCSAPATNRCRGHQAGDWRLYHYADKVIPSAVFSLAR